MNRRAADFSALTQDAHTYRVSLKWKLIFIVLGGFALIGGAAGTIYFGTGHEMHSRAQTAAFVAGGLAFCFLGVVLIAYCFRFRVVLHADAIEVFGLRSQRHLLRKDIVGRRTVEQQSYS